MLKHSGIVRGFHPWKVGPNTEFLESQGEKIPKLEKIIVKGKEYTGEWVYGNALGDSLIIRAGTEFHMSGTPDQYDDTLVSSGLIHNLYADRILPETRATCTGQIDKNGRMIFEDMVVRTKRGIGYIIFDEGCFCVKIFNELSKPALDIVLNEGDVEVIYHLFSDIAYTVNSEVNKNE